MTSSGLVAGLGLFLILLAWFFLLLEAYGLIRFSNIYSRMLISALADTVAMILIFLGLMLSQENPVGTSKVLVLLIFLLIMNPVTTHLIVRSARRNGIGLEDRKEDR